MRPRVRARLAVGALTLTMVGGVAGCGVIGGDDPLTLSASFDRTVGLYKNSDVRILGVRIGKVVSIVPDGTAVKVTMEYDPKFKVPADAKAVVIAPSIVSDRYVQLTPVWTGGPVLASGAVIRKDDTAVPVELDQIFASLNTLNLKLGPDGANKNGAVSDLLKVGAENLKGNGTQLNKTLSDFSGAVQTLANNRDDLFGTVRNLQDFTTTVANSDDIVRAFNGDLASVANQLDGEKEDLALAITQLSTALGEVSTFVRDNKTSLTANVSDLADVTGTLVRQKAALEEFLDTAPTALTNLQLAYNSKSGTLDTRADNFGDELGGTLCGIALGALPQLGVELPTSSLCNTLVGGQLPGLPGLPDLPGGVPGLPALPVPAPLAPGTPTVAGQSATAPTPVGMPDGLTSSFASMYGVGR